MNALSIILIMLAATGMAQTVRAKPATRKRGFSGFLANNSPGSGYWSCDDARYLGLANSWYYNWLSETSQGNYCKKHGYWGSDQAKEFAPMIIGIGSTKGLLKRNTWMEEFERANVHFLLGYNEPDPSAAQQHPHQCSPADAAKDWPNVQAVAAMFDPPLTLVSPAPSSEDWTADGVSEWLDQFFGNCTDVVEECDPDLIKYIAFHDYVGNTKKLERRINGMTPHYGGRKLWITEFGIGRWDPPNGPDRDEQDAYMEEVLPMLEANENVYRYAWFTSRQVGEQSWGGTKSLLPYNLTKDDPGCNTPTSTGRIYQHTPEFTQN